MIPKTIWCLWLQGWQNAPDLVKACRASWQRLNPGWTIHYLTRENFAQHLELTPALQSVIAKNLPMEALSNVIRAELLKRHGGVWVDATAYCLRSLDGWIHAAAAGGFFAYDRPGPDRMLATWFLAAEPGSRIVDIWLRRAYAYWRDRAERHTYFWFHGLFREAYASDEELRALWDATPKISTGGPDAFSPYAEHLFRPVADSDRLLVETAQTQLLKLTHKIDHGAVAPGSVYDWLCGRVLPAPEPDETIAVRPAVQSGPLE